MKIEREMNIIFRLDEDEQFDTFSIWENVRVDRVIYRYDPDGDGNDAFEELRMKGQKLKANGTIDKRAGDFYYAYPTPELEAKWMAKARQAARELAMNAVTWTTVKDQQ